MRAMIRCLAAVLTILTITLFAQHSYQVQALHNIMQLHGGGVDDARDYEAHHDSDLYDDENAAVMTGSDDALKAEMWRIMSKSMSTTDKDDEQKLAS